jgi:TPR repeat protein
LDSGLEPDMPLAEAYQALLHAAESGNARASCRLGTELARCTLYFERAAALEEQISSAATMPTGSPDERALLESIARERLSLARSEKVCRGITLDQARGAWRHVYRAAKAGHLPSVLAFAIQPPLSETNFSADLEGWAVYRREAVPMLEFAAQRGSPRAMYQLAWVYGNLPVPGGAPLVARDPVRAVAYALLARQYADAASKQQIERMIGSWRTELGPDGLGRATALADHLASTMQPQLEHDLDFVNAQVSQPEDCDR